MRPVVALMARFASRSVVKRSSSLIQFLIVSIDQVVQHLSE